MSFPGRRVSRLASAGLAVAGLCGCAAKAQRAAEPAVAPPLTASPAGRVIGVGGLPEGIVADPRTRLVAVAVRNPAALALVDARTLSLVRRIPLGGAARHLSLDGANVLVPGERSNQLFVVRLPAGQVTTIGVGTFPHDAAAADGRIAVGDELGGRVSVIAGRRVIATLGGVVQPGGVVSIGGGRVAVIDVRARRLVIYRLNPPQLLDGEALGAGPTHAVVASGEIFVADTGGNRVVMLSQSRLPVSLGSVSLPGVPYGIAVDPARQRLWVTLTARNQLVEYSILVDGLREVRRYPTVRQPDTVAVDIPTGRVFVAGRTDGLLEAIDPPNSRVVRTGS